MDEATHDGVLHEVDQGRILGYSHDAVPHKSGTGLWTRLLTVLCYTVDQGRGRGYSHDTVPHRVDQGLLTPCAPYSVAQGRHGKLKHGIM